MIEGIDKIFGGSSTVSIQDGIGLIHRSVQKAANAEEQEAKATLARTYHLMKAMNDSELESDEFEVDDNLLSAVMADADEAGDTVEKMSKIVEKIEKRFLVSKTKQVPKETKKASVQKNDDDTPSWGSNQLNVDEFSEDELNDWGKDPDGVWPLNESSEQAS